MNLLKKAMIKVFLIACSCQPIGGAIITNGSLGNTGDSILSFCLAKIASKKYNLPFYLEPFDNADIFKLSDMESKFEKTNGYENVTIKNEHELISNINKDNVNLKVTHYLFIPEIDFDWKHFLKPYLTLKNRNVLKQRVNDLPADYLCIAVHIRKGNGGVHYTDGQQSSRQLFNHDRSKITYIYAGEIFPFDWIHAPIRPTSNKQPPRSLNIDRISDGFMQSPSLIQSVFNKQQSRGLTIDRMPNWVTKFPPEQYYVDQIQKISQENPNKSLFVQIFTDDRNPPALLNRIKKAVNKQNTIFYYQDNRSFSYKERVAQDLYNMARFDVLIRSQSNFARAAELVGDFKMVIFPLDYRWEGNKLLMYKIFVKKT